MEYKSALKAPWQTPTHVEFFDATSGDIVGIVYKNNGLWYLSTKYFNAGDPLEVFTKYEGFILLNKLHKAATCASGTGTILP
jgi:hypothetical protein